MKSHVAHFVVEGEFIVRTARDALLSERPSLAWKIIAEGLVGDGVEAAAIAVLKGDKTLAGDSSVGISLEDENPAARDDFQKELRYVYAGRCRWWGKWYRPVAKVTSWGREDARWALKHGLERISQYRCGDKKPERSVYYCNEEERVFVIDERKTEEDKVPSRYKVAAGHYVFERCDEPPFWWPENTSPEKALEAFEEAGRRLEERGCAERPENEGPDPIVIKSVEVDKLSEEQQKEAFRLQDEEDRLSEERRVAQLASYRQDILEQAGDDLFDLAYDGGCLKVPRAPFWAWALGRRPSLRHLGPAWDSVCPSGMKMMMDDPYHTDWMVGAGLDPQSEEHYGFGSKIQEAANHLMFEIQERLGQSECSVISRGPTHGGAAFHPKLGERSPVGSVVVLPNLNPKYFDSIIDVAAVVTEEGGALAHLAQVGRESGVAIVRVPGALEKFPAGCHLFVTTDDDGTEKPHVSILSG
jgi:phosphohistidine swiveling domain-containing protein